MCWLITFGVMFLACVFFVGALAGLAARGDGR